MKLLFAAVLFLVAATAFAGDEIEGRGPWPDDLPFPAGMVRYQTATKTQSIFVDGTGGIDRDVVRPIRRGTLERKYVVPGGLVDAEGWRSDLYRFLPAEPVAWKGNISVLNSSGYMQNNRGWRRTYVDGSFFCDALSVNGKVFEVRYRTKENGRWVSDIAWRDRSTRPAGFVPVRTKDCQSCHREAGSGIYGAGLVPGSDNVFSHGFEALERLR